MEKRPNSENDLGIFAFPLTRGEETGRGLERVIEKFCGALTHIQHPYQIYERGLITNEIAALMAGVRFFFNSVRVKNTRYLAVYPVAALFPLLLRKRPITTAVHDLIPVFVTGFDNRVKYFLKRICIRFACKKSDHIIVPFPSTKQQIMDLYGVISEKITIVPYGVDHSNYYPDPATTKVRHRVAFLGEAKQAKGIDSAIRAFQLVHQKLPTTTLILASNGRELEAMKKLAADLLKPGSYKFVGFVPENKMREFYNSSQVFLFPSRYGFGLSSLESMACGTPAIVGASLDARDFINDPDLLVNPDDFAGLASKILALLTDEGKYLEKSKNAFGAAAKFSWEAMAGRYLEVCREQKVL